MRGALRRIQPFRAAAWYFMRISGLLLVFAVLFHMFWNTVVYPDHELTWDLIVSRYYNPFWRLFDLTLLGLSVLHGFYGLAVIMQEYLRPGALRTTLFTVFHALWISIMAFGTFVVMSFPWRPG